MAEEFSIRLATIDDMQKVFELSNDDVVRANSINQEKFQWENHVKWFENRIKKIDEPFYIVESLSGEFIAQVRFDKKEEIIISISITKPFRGKGLASEIIKKSIALSKYNNVTAYIYNTNLASIKTFTHAGFIQDNILKFTYKHLVEGVLLIWRGRVTSSLIAFKQTCLKALCLYKGGCYA